MQNATAVPRSTILPLIFKSVVYRIIPLLMLCVFAVPNELLAQRKVVWSSEAGVNIKSVDGTSRSYLVRDHAPIHFAFDSINQNLYWAEFGLVRKANYDGSSIEEVMDGLADLVDLDVDASNGKIYWIEGRTNDWKIKRANTAGSDIETIVAGIPAISDLFVDTTGAKVYWAKGSGGSRTVMRSDLDGGNAEELFGTIPNFSKMAVDPSGGKVYWIDSSNRQIRRANMDGSNFEILHTEHFGPINALTSLVVNPATGKIYWVNIFDDELLRSNLDGTGDEVLLTDFEASAVYIDLGGQKLYWPSGAGIVSSNLSGGSQTTVFESSLWQKPNAIAADTVGEKLYFSDAVTDRIIRINYDGSGFQSFFGSETPRMLHGFWVDRQAGKLYWTDEYRGSIHRADLDLSNPETIIENIDGAVGITGSHDHGKIYFVSGGTNKILSANLNGTEVEDLIIDVRHGRHIAIDVYSSKLYYLDSYQIWRSNLNGSNEELVPVNAGDGVSGMAVDTAGRKIYWADYLDNTIYRADLDGSNEEVFADNLNRPTYLTLLPDIDTGYSVAGDVFQDGEPVVNAKVVFVESSSGSSTYEAATDSSGTFLVKNVAPGTYNIHVEKSGMIVGRGNVEVSDANVTGVGLPISSAVTLSNPTWVQWNTFLDMVNVVEIVNKADIELTVALENFRVGVGPSVGEQSISVAANSQVDVIVNDLAGTIADSYGIMKLVGSHGDFDGRMAVYRPSDANPQEFSYAYSVPFSNPLTNKAYVLYNTFQPSVASYLSGIPVSNWLSLTNLDTGSKTFKVYFYSQTGQLAHEANVEVPAFSRIDIDGGHESVGANSAGLVEVVPLDASAPYLAMLARYSLGNSASGDDAFSLSQLARDAGSAVQYLPLMDIVDTWNFLEVGNTSAAPIDITIGIYDISGAKVSELALNLSGHGVQHINAREILNGSLFGIAKIEDSTKNAVLTYGLLYRFNPASGGIVGLEYSEGREPFGRSFSGSYNTFLAMSNWLRVLNVSDENARVTIDVEGFTPSYSYTIPAMSRFDIELNREPFNVGSSLYGLVSVTADQPGQIISEVVRLKPTSNGMLDSSISSLVR